MPNSMLGYLRQMRMSFSLGTLTNSVDSRVSI